LKILQNPIAVGVLALVAVVLLVQQIFWPMIQHSHWMQPEPAAASPAAAAPKPAPRPEPGNSTHALAVAVNVMPEFQIDGGPAGASAARAAESPRRDPFQGRMLPTSQAKPNESARELLTFSGFWQQSGTTLAVINNQVVAVGDSVMGFKVESIEHDLVWVDGPNGHEAVGFGGAHQPFEAVAPQPVAVAPVMVPDEYAWDGAEYVGPVGDQYFYLGPDNVWLLCDPIRLDRFHGWEREHRDWREHAIRNDHYRTDHNDHVQPRHDVPTKTTPDKKKKDQNER
jgi:hypothetical protein